MSVILPPGPDRPGDNVELRPDQAPPWLRRLAESAATDPESRAIGRAAKEAAVLVLLTGNRTSTDLPADAGILITHRSPTMRSHAGQMAFPGGRVDPGDVNAVDCALREAWEETGLDRTSVTPLAQFESAHVRTNKNPVHPVLAYWENPSELVATSLEETDDVYVAPIAELADPANRVMVKWFTYRGPAFRSNGYLIWGFTGAIIDAALRAGGWEREWDRLSTRSLRSELAASRNQES